MKYCPKCGLTMRSADPTEDGSVLDSDMVCRDCKRIYRAGGFQDETMMSFSAPADYQYHASSDPKHEG